MEVQVYLSGQQLKIRGKTILASGTNLFVGFKFELDDVWKDLRPFCQFRQNGVAYNIFLDENDTAYLPREIKGGICEMMLYATDNQHIATTAPLVLHITDSGLIEDAESTDTTPTLYQQLVGRVDNLIAGAAIDPNAEIIDARVGSDGYVYDNLGAAIRGKASMREIETMIAGKDEFTRWLLGEN